MWEQEIAVARQAAQEAGQILRHMLGKVNRISKKAEIDLVTEADLQSEKAILDIISRKFPEDSILSEERGESRHLPDRVWLIDPLDGTTNFAHCLPFFAISIALEVKKNIVLGLVFNPYWEEYFEAVEGMGAFLKQKPIQVSQTMELGEALLVTGFPYDVHQKPQRVMELFQKMLVRAQGIRRLGSAAIDLCYVAAGRFDGFWEAGLKPWDTAAGMIILQEAGGKLSNYDSEPYSPYSKSIVASNPFIHSAMLRALNASDEKRAAFILDNPPSPPLESL
jgi:myo-inositol-1(or 4)-monophosphatase